MRRPLQIVASFLLIAAAVGALDAAPALATGFSYTFDTTNEGWRSGNGAGGPLVSASHSSEGNPGGAISVSDTSPAGYSFFASPTSIANNYGANFGGTLSMDIKSSPAWANEEGAVALVGSANGEEPLCMYEEGVLPGLTYQHLEYTLDGAHTYLADCTTHATDAQVSEVLSTLLGFFVAGEDGVSTGETTTIDNVSLSGGAPLSKYRLTLLKAGTGSGSVASSPAGIACGATCSAEFLKGTLVTLTATPASGSTFAGWSGGGCAGTGTCQVTLGGDREVTALFNVVSVPGGGTTPLVETPKKPLTCKKGFKKKKVHGVFRCVKIKKHHHRHHGRR